MRVALQLPERKDELIELPEVVADDERAGVAGHHRVVFAALQVGELGKGRPRRHPKEAGEDHRRGSRAHGGANAG